MAAKKKARSARTSRSAGKRVSSRKSSTRSSSRSGRRASAGRRTSGNRGVTTRAVKAVKQVGRKLGIVNKR